jgi:hypothetical protein
MSPLAFRLGALAFAFFMILTGVFSLYWLYENVLPIYGRIYRNAPVVETPYLALGLLERLPHAQSVADYEALLPWNCSPEMPR